MNRNHPLIETFFILLNNDYDLMSWNYHGSEIINSLMNEFCGFNHKKYDKKILENSDTFCHKISLFPYYAFFPIHYDHWSEIFHSFGEEQYKKKSTKRMLFIYGTNYLTLILLILEPINCIQIYLKLIALKQLKQLSSFNLFKFYIVRVFYMFLTRIIQVIGRLM